MVCPKCGSENVQFLTSASGGGYKVGKGLCGYMILGPLGFLCGACGSGIKSNEFWICNKCGYKFDNTYAKETVAIAEKCERYKQGLGNQPLQYYTRQYEVAKQNLENANVEYEKKFNEHLEKYSSENEEVAKYRKKYGKGSTAGSVIIAIIIILGVFFSMLGAFFIGIPMAVGGIIAAIVRPKIKHSATKRIEEIFTAKDPDFKSVINRKETAKREEEHWKELSEKAEYVKNHDKS